jgi:transcriptional regulator with XRE-family HTH domain
MTQATLAARSGLSRTQLVRIERGQVKPAPGTYNRLVGALGYTLGAELLAAAGSASAAEHVKGFAVRQSAPRSFFPTWRRLA